MSKFIAWLKSLFAKKTTQSAIAPTVTAPAPLITPVNAAVPMSAGIEYAKYVTNPEGQPYTPYELSTRFGVFPNNVLPKGWDWPTWAVAAGKPNPLTHDNRGQEIQWFALTTAKSVTGNGHMVVPLGESRQFTLTKPGEASWVAMPPQYLGPAEIHIGGVVYRGAYMGDVKLSAGENFVTLVSGPAQGIDFALRS